jgi:hypothetical protein
VRREEIRTGARTYDKANPGACAEVDSLVAAAGSVRPKPTKRMSENVLGVVLQVAVGEHGGREREREGECYDPARVSALLRRAVIRHARMRNAML